MHDMAIHCAHTEVADLVALVPHPRNPNRHPEEQIRLLAKIMAHQGWRNAIVVSRRSGFIVKGHGRLAAAQLNGWEQAPVDRQDYATEADEWADMVADNRIAELAEPDAADTLALLGDLGEGFDAELMGFDAEGMRALEDAGGVAADALAGALGEGDDDIPDDVPAVTKPGDIWAMGEHRLICGDSTLPETVNRLMAGATADLVFTSPPYDQQRDYTQKITDWQALMRGVFTVMPAGEHTQVLVNLGLVHRDGEWQPYWDPWIEWMRVQGWRRFGWYVWDQGSGLPGAWSGRLAPSHEWVFHFNRVSRTLEKTRKSQMAGLPYGKRHVMRAADGSLRPFSSLGELRPPTKLADSVIRITRQQGSVMPGTVGHPAAFPVALALDIHAAFTSPGGVAYEPFSGSGTSILAAEKLGRRCYASELEPKYCDIAIARWEKLTGKKAQRA